MKPMENTLLFDPPFPKRLKDEYTDEQELFNREERDDWEERDD